MSSQSGNEQQQDDSKNQSDGLSIFCREVRNLLRSKPNCMIPFSKFVPAYHNHYGRQCCVYQFGYTKLIELLESIPHVVQIIGDGTNRYITLTHREQIKRFASDLIKVVKSQPGKKLKLSQFARAYEQVLGRIFRVEDYGTNNINVLLAEIWEGTINIMPIKREFVDEQSICGPLFVANGNNNTNGCSTNGIATTGSTGGGSTGSTSCNSSHESSILSQLVASCELVNKPYITEQYPDAWFEIPKRERSDKEIKRTKYFVWDVIELLSNIEPDYSVQFSKFIPSYHYYFNRQCKVSIFGFSKLIDLFESISPDVVEIIDQGPGEEKIIKLADQHVPINRNRNRSRHHQHHHRLQLQLKQHFPTTTTTTTASNGGGVQVRKSPIKLSYNDYDDDEDEDEDEDEEEECDDIIYDDNDDDEEEEEEVEEEEDDESSSYGDDGVVYVGSGGKPPGRGEDKGDDVILPMPAIDSGPTEEELMELEDELKAYEELKAIQSKRSTRMAAILDIFKYSIY